MYAFLQHFKRALPMTSNSVSYITHYDDSSVFATCKTQKIDLDCIYNYLGVSGTLSFSVVTEFKALVIEDSHFASPAPRLLT